VNILDQLLPEAGAFYLLDRGYVDFARLHFLAQGCAFFVTRAKKKCSSTVATHVRRTIGRVAKRPDHSADRSANGPRYPILAAHPLFRCREGFLPSPASS